MTKPATDNAKERSNRVIALACLAFFGGMVGVSFAAVPLYQLFCQITGYGGTTKRVEQYSDRDFAPVERTVTVKIGETVQVAYRAKNVAARPASGRASFNVSPHLAGAYFMKVECFCFTDTELKPGETMDMPVVFYVDPEIVDVPELRDLRTITLSYTFFPIEGRDAVETSQVGGGAGGTATQDTDIGG
jgi:cytochrome c oxidase assembly protein subunit 11